MIIFQMLIVSGITDIWSAIRNNCATKMMSFVECFSIPNLKDIFETLLAVSMIGYSYVVFPNTRAIFSKLTQVSSGWFSVSWRFQWKYENMRIKELLSYLWIFIGMKMSDEDTFIETFKASTPDSDTHIGKGIWSFGLTAVG